MLAFRFLSGLFGASSINNAGATIGDVSFSPDARKYISAGTHLQRFAQMTTPLERNRFMLFYALCAFGGPAVSPIVAGFTEAFAPTWRWNLYVCAIIVGTITLVCIAGLDETHHATIIYRRAMKQGKGNTVKRKSKQEIISMFKTAIARPAIILTTEPIAILISLYLGVLYAILYGFFGSFSVIFMYAVPSASLKPTSLTCCCSNIRGFTVWQYGLTYISIGIGFILGGVVRGLLNFPRQLPYRLVQIMAVFAQRILAKEYERTGGKPRPEMRFIQAFWGGPLAAMCVIAFGSRKSGHSLWRRF